MRGSWKFSCREMLSLETASAMQDPARYRPQDLDGRPQLLATLYHTIECVRDGHIADVQHKLCDGVDSRSQC